MDSTPAIRPLIEYSPEENKAAVAARYGQVATAPEEKFNFPVERKFAESVGYGPAKLDPLPRGTRESFTSVGNPQPYVGAQPSETVLDLCLYAEQVGPSGKLHGLDYSSRCSTTRGTTCNIREPKREYAR